MTKNTVRLKQFTLNNIKNVRHGSVMMPDAYTLSAFPEQAGILGIYGQNGSGKTAVIDALYFLRFLMAGESLPKSFSELADISSDTAGITAVFDLYDGGKVREAEYRVVFGRKEGVFGIEEEILSVRERSEKPARKTVLLHVVREDGMPVIRPKKRETELVRLDRRNRTELPVALRMADIAGQSLIFGEGPGRLFSAVPEEAVPELGGTVYALKTFGADDFYVILSGQTGLHHDSLTLMASDYKDLLAAGKNLTVNLTEPALYTAKERDVIVRWKDSINTVLSSIIPGLTLIVKDHGGQTADNGESGFRLEILSKRSDDTPFPLRRESEGIVKIISVLNALIRAFGDPSVLVAIDELDAGVYEYMLGELMDIFENSARGQLIFTSHNLRALEMLDDRSVMFSTANPSNRYIHMKHDRVPVNLRDVYLRGITLGGQEEVIYEETDSLKIARAFRKAAKVYGNE